MAAEWRVRMKTRGVKEIKSENKQAVYRYILTHEASTKQDIYMGLGLSLPTIKVCLEFLEENGLIYAADVVRNTGGRNATAYRVMDHGRFAAGVFLSPNHITALCVNLRGEVVCSRRVREKFDAHNDGYLRKVGDLTEQVIEESRLDKKTFLGVGIAVPSLVSADGEQMVFGLTRNYTNITRELLSRYIPYPTLMFHDSTVAGFAEVWVSSQIENAVYLNLNDTIGGSVIVGNHVYDGDNCRAGEIGHIIIRPKDGKRCYCGQIGCLDTCCSATVLSALTNGNIEDYFHLLDEQDPAAVRAWDAYTDDLALAIHNLRMICDSQIIIGGYIGANINGHMDELCAKVDALEIFGGVSRQYILPCRYKIESTAAGAALEMIEKFISRL